MSAVEKQIQLVTEREREAKTETRRAPGRKIFTETETQRYTEIQRLTRRQRQTSGPSRASSRSTQHLNEHVRSFPNSQFVKIPQLKGKRSILNERARWAGRLRSCRARRKREREGSQGKGKGEREG